MIFEYVFDGDHMHEYNGKELLGLFLVDGRVMVRELRHFNARLSILDTCQQYRIEALPVMMAKSHFCCMVPETWEKGFVFEIPAELLRYIKRLSVVYQNSDFGPRPYLDAIMLLDLVGKHAISLNMLHLCIDEVYAP